MVRLSVFCVFALSVVLSAVGPRLNATPAPVTADWGPSTLSYAGAGAGLSVDHDAFLNNPANLVYFGDANSVAGSYQELPRDEQRWSTSIIDGTLPVVSGFHFASDDFGDSERQSFTLGGAYKTPYGAFGGSAFAQKFSNVPTGNGWHFSGSVGVLIPVTWGLALAAFSRHLLDLEADRNLPRDINMAIVYTHTNKARASFQADRMFSIPHQSWNYSAALDILAYEYFAIRGGYRWDHSGAYDFWSAGAAILGPKMEITAAYIQAMEGSHTGGFTAGLSLKM